MSIGSAIKRLREEHRPQKMTQEELSRASGVSRETIAVIETEARPAIRSDTLEKLARGLGVEVSGLFETHKARRPKTNRKPSRKVA